MKNKFILTLSSVLLLTVTVFCFADKKEELAKVKQSTLIAAYGTSYSPESSNAVTLLDPASKGYWQPRSKDFGASEGVYFQFLEPVLINWIEVIVEGDVKDKLTLQPYLDGQTQSRKAEIGTRELWSGNFKNEGGKSNYYRTATKDADGNYYYVDIYDKKQLLVPENEDGNELKVFEESYYAELYNITAVAEVKNGNTVFTIKENNTKELNYTAKSVFLKIKDAEILPKFKSIKIYGEDKKIPVAINLPLTPKAAVTASSVLNPPIAYSSENLFDSQLDMAWSTNGKETDGIGQSVTVNFDGKEEIGGIIIWNGYQRSKAHFEGNGRVKKLDINGQIVEVADKQGLQTIILPKKIKTDKITLTIKEIFKSKKYKDVLISELRFITPEGQIILPQVRKASEELSKNDIVKTDMTYVNLISYVDDFGEAEYSSYAASKDTFRIRSNGSFVLYREGENESAGISEGNWQELGKNKIRIFGKKYRITPSVTKIYSYSGYDSRVDDPNVEPTNVIIFQSDITFSKYNSLTKKEQEKIVKFLLKDIGEPSPWYVSTRAKTQEGFSADKYFKRIDYNDFEDEEEFRDEYGRHLNIAMAVMFEDLLTAFEKINPVYIKSDVYTGLMIPYDEAI